MARLALTSVLVATLALVAAQADAQTEERELPAVQTSRAAVFVGGSTYGGPQVLLVRRFISSSDLPLVLGRRSGPFYGSAATGQPAQLPASQLHTFVELQLEQLREQVSLALAMRCPSLRQRMLSAALARAAALKALSSSADAAVSASIDWATVDEPATSTSMPADGGWTSAASADSAGAAASEQPMDATAASSSEFVGTGLFGTRVLRDEENGPERPWGSPHDPPRSFLDRFWHRGPPHGGPHFHHPGFYHDHHHHGPHHRRHAGGQGMESALRFAGRGEQEGSRGAAVPEFLKWLPFGADEVPRGAPPPPPFLDWSLRDEEGRLNWPVLVFALLSAGCAVMWVAVLLSIVDGLRGDWCGGEGAARRQFVCGGGAGDEDEALLKPAKGGGAEGERAVVVAAEHAPEGQYISLQYAPLASE